MDEEFLKLDIGNDAKSDNKPKEQISGDKKESSDSKPAHAKNNDSSIQSNEGEYMKRVSSNILTELSAAVHNLQQESKQTIQSLNNTIVNLEKESYILQKLPSHFKENINLAIPEISKEIRVQCLSDLDVSMKKCYDNVILLEDATAAMLEQSKTFESVKMKKTMILMAITIIISVSCSASLTYFMMRKFPHFVSLDTRGNVRIDNSQIYLTEKKEPTVSATTEKLKPGKGNR